MDLNDTLRTIAEHAPKLRAAGVQSLSIDGIAMVLSPPEPRPYVSTEPEQKVDEDDTPKRDADDPTTYGRAPGTPAPGFKRPDDLPRKA